MKKLIILSHPEFEKSIINKRWVEEAEKYPDEITVRHIDECFEGAFDIEEEQRIVETHGPIIFQFPVYWFSIPSLGKKWMDEVIAGGWAFGGGDAFKDRKVAVAASFGVLEENMKESGAYKFTADEDLAHIHASCLYMGADYRGHHCLYGAEHQPSRDYIEENTKAYIDFIRSL